MLPRVSPWARGQSSGRRALFPTRFSIPIGRRLLGSLGYIIFPPWVTTDLLVRVGCLG
jgi:hypothetical protein